MAETSRPPDAQRRAELRGRIVAEGRRRLRRRRLVAFGGVVAIVCATAGLLGPRVVGSDDGTHRVVVSGEPPSTDRPSTNGACQAGGAIKPGQALVGTSIRFRSLPPGFTVHAGKLGTDPVLIAAEASPPNPSAPTSRPTNVSTPTGPNLEATVTTGGEMPLNLGAGAIPVRVEGHAALVESYTESRASAAETNVEWQPNRDVNILVSGTGLPVAEVLAAARHLAFVPGVPAPPIGSLGPVIPRSTAIALMQPPKGARIVTWLVTDRELTAAELAGGQGGYSEGPPPNAIQGLKPDHPLWVVLALGPTKAGTAGRGPAAASHVKIFDAANGQFHYSSDDKEIALLFPQIPRLVDHSGDQPCPSPSSTDPGLQPPLEAPSAYPTGISSVTAPVSELIIPGIPGSVELGAGTDQGLAEGDTVTVPSTSGRPGTLVGQIVNIAAGASQVQLVMANPSVIGVALDAAGDDAVVVGNGTGKPLNVDLINRKVRLHAGQRLSTTGRPYSPVAAGIPVGTIASVEPAADDRSPTVTLTPGFDPSTLTSVEVLLRTGT